MGTGLQNPSMATTNVISRHLHTVVYLSSTVTTAFSAVSPMMQCCHVNSMIRCQSVQSSAFLQTEWIPVTVDTSYLQ